MANKFDPYREALVMEAITLWPEEYDDWDPLAKRRVEEALHSQPEKAEELTYLRQHTGFRRDITVTPSDLERIG